MHKNARAFKAHAFIAHGVGYVKKKARAFISHAMHIKARDMKKTARAGRSALFLKKARAVIVHRCPGGRAVDAGALPGVAGVRSQETELGAARSDAGR